MTVEPMALWLDIEATGLDEHNPNARILEIAWVMAPLRAPHDLLGEIETTPIMPADFDAIVSKMAPKVVEMHTNSGLMADLRLAGPHPNVAEVEQILIEMLPKPSTLDNAYRLAGFGTHFDLRWLTKHMPKFTSSHLHYTPYDVRQIETFAMQLGMTKIVKEKPHRAKADIESAIDTWIQAVDYVTDGHGLPE